jgi:hypothetical protein
VAARLARPGALREGVLAGQDRRLQAFTPQAVETVLRGYLDAL